MSEDTRTRILDAAQRLFADSGIDATSLRSITSAAGVNLAAVNYHFGSKNALVREVYGRRIRPVNEARLQRLEQTLREAEGRPPSIEGIMESFMAPALLALLEPEGPDLVRLMGRAHSDTAPEVRQEVLSQFIEVLTAFTAALQAALPHVPLAETQLRFKFAVGAMVFAMIDPLPFANGQRPPDREAVDHKLGALVEFLAAGFRAAGTEAAA
jgi:AcrR family transcriptional regulator